MSTSVGESLRGIIQTHAADHGNRVAFVCSQDGQRMDFARWAALTERMVAALRQSGIRMGDVVAACVELDAEFMPLMAACSALGARLLPLPPGLRPATMRAILDHCGPKLVLENGLAGWAATLTAEAGPQPDECGSEEPCLILQSGGMTGSPKPTLLTASNLFAMARGFLATHPLWSGDVVLTHEPFSTAGGVGVGAIIPLLAAARVVAAPDFRSPAEYWAFVHQHGITVCDASPARLAWLLAGHQPGDPPPPAAVRFFLCGGGVLPELLWSAFEQAFGRPVHHGYGMTETTFWAACSPPRDPGANHRPGLRPMSACDIAIRPLRGGMQPPRRPGPTTAMEPETADFGEILIRGPSVMPGYHKRNNLTHTAFENGYFRTGDLGWFDGDGNLVVRARMQSLVSRDGVTVAIEDIDWHLGAHPGLVASKTVLAPGPNRRNQIVSVCEPRTGPGQVEAEAEAVAHWLRTRPDAPPQPDQVLCVAALPRGANGQIPASVVASMVTGTLRDEIVASLGSRRYRRDPPYREDALGERLQDAILLARPVEFVMLWGCGARDSAGPADRAALDAIIDLMAEPKRLPHIACHVTIIFTDVHATSNGHSPAHFQAYFNAVKAAAAGLDASFELESEVWARGGLTPEKVRQLAATPEFESYWQDFPLRDKFVGQATRHSRNADPAAAGRHYLATCRMERGVMERLFPAAVFLTYNGPEFNECFPDLPTLYIYPGPRGRTVKPWFC